MLNWLPWARNDICIQKEAQTKSIVLYLVLKVEVFAENTGKTKEQIETDIRCPKYFSASEAVEYGLIDKVLQLKYRVYLYQAFRYLVWI